MDVEAARADWTAVRPLFCHFACLLKTRIDSLTKELGIYAEVTARAKETASLVKKLLLKPHLKYETLPDKVGVRVVLRYRRELPGVESCIRQHFSYREIDDKGTKLGTDKVGYQSVHVDAVGLLDNDPEQQAFPRERFWAELQLRTLAQHLWSEVSHDTFYKNDELVNQLEPDLRRRVNLTAGLVEVADREFDRMSEEAKPNNAAEMFMGLEKLYYSVASRRPDVELSLEVIQLVLPLYGGLSIQEILGEQVIPRFEHDKAALAHVFSDPDVLTTNASPFLFQPEALLLYDRLQTDRDQLLAKWNERFPEHELDLFASTVGVSLQ